MTIQRVEVITGRESRRRFSDTEKRQLVEEAFQPGTRATDIARRHGMDVSLLYRWRRLIFGRRPRLPAFAPVAVVEGAGTSKTDENTELGGVGVIEIEFVGGTRVRVSGAVETGTLASIIAALMKRQ